MLRGPKVFIRQPHFGHISTSRERLCFGPSEERPANIASSTRPTVMRIVLSTHQREAKIPSAMDVVIRTHGLETLVPHFVQKRADACLSAE